MILCSWQHPLTFTTLLLTRLGNLDILNASMEWIINLMTLNLSLLWPNKSLLKMCTRDKCNKKLIELEKRQADLQTMNQLLLRLTELTYKPESILLLMILALLLSKLIVTVLFSLSNKLERPLQDLTIKWEVLRLHLWWLILDSILL